jgi:hypothetical protein
VLLRLVMIDSDMDKFIDHEVRIRVMEEMSKRIEKRFDIIDAKMDNQFKWIIGTIITMIGGLIVTKLI